VGYKGGCPAHGHVRIPINFQFDIFFIPIENGQGRTEDGLDVGPDHDLPYLSSQETEIHVRSALVGVSLVDVV